jgi:hypothetical protein
MSHCSWKLSFTFQLFLAAYCQLNSAICRACALSAGCGHSEPNASILLEQRCAFGPEVPIDLSSWLKMYETVFHGCDQRDTAWTVWTVNSMNQLAPPPPGSLFSLKEILWGEKVCSTFKTIASRRPGCQTSWYPASVPCIRLQPR